jgi:hypothetical protein
MSVQQRVWVSVVGLCALGTGAVLGRHTAGSEGLFGPACQVEPVALSSELDVQSAFPFESEAPIRGVLQPGALVRVHFVKGDVAYATVETALDLHMLESALAPR